jgi:hypothetical protein
MAMKTPVRRKGMIELRIKLKIFCYDCGKDLTEQISIGEYDGVTTELTLKPCPYCIKKAFNDGYQAGFAEEQR